jgi:hypothetical protein
MTGKIGSDSVCVSLREMTNKELLVRDDSGRSSVDIRVPFDFLFNIDEICVTAFLILQ